MRRRAIGGLQRAGEQNTVVRLERDRLAQQGVSGGILSGVSARIFGSA